MLMFRRRVFTAVSILSLTTFTIMYNYTRTIATTEFIEDLHQKAIDRDKFTNANITSTDDIYRNLKEILFYGAKTKRTNISRKERLQNTTGDIRDMRGARHVNRNTEKNKENISVLPSSVGGEKRIRIVLYHFYHTLLKWSAKKLDMKKCYHSSNCEIIDRVKCSRDAIDAEAIVFQGNNMPRDRPTRLNSDQVFVYLNIESPQYLQVVRLSNPFFDDFYNWTMTYRRDSDIPYLYGSVMPRSMNKTEYLSRAEITGVFPNFENDDISGISMDIEDKNYEEIFRKKTKSSVWFVSHCGTASRREKYVSRMTEYTDIDIFGRCSNKTNTCPKKNPDCGQEVKQIYKFFIAFENSLCEDYITEKVFKWFSEDIVVVVRGARYYKRYLPTGTYIDADDFASPEDLAKFLTYLGSNEKEYIGYLKKRDMYRVISEVEHIQSAYCNLCYKLNNLEQYRKQAQNIHRWWNVGKCATPTPI